MCINFKQMGMYFSLVYLFYVLNDIVNNDKNDNYNDNDNNKDKDKNNNKFKFKFLFFIKFILNILLYGFITILTNIIIWSPWIFSGKANEVLTRIFPIQRGIFEDKVNKNYIFY
jgi:hypothetical protein